ncbi:predicted protein [Naegleria gruberi]|uniref:Predicted protein n=1 Tax=Naegleria gruberi TaxID=5762 RepID=D2VRL3_NAEGR|nr:uncharacterized protein NAEGRDRAFT_71626 [Naegleria gruberi]EFC40412.1 predicted protein [Naegleria gruberi]|eukprot:XP_002673156.1 predicted protein [Naegleria gruberi strain NEG-M]
MKNTQLIFGLSALLCFILLNQLFVFIKADVYMHNPRGSNDRNCEFHANRNNANRLFDSQNNAAGGYACPRMIGGPEVVTPRMYYYVGSELPIEWTSQHSCGFRNTYCNVVIQYMCNDTAPNLRDGTPENEKDAATDTISEATNNNPRYGLHEPMEYYMKCRTRRRNSGLYIADQRQENWGRLLENSPAVETRQNPNGNRHGWECPEERDYYPYWHPTPWKDIAIFTFNTSMCQWYQENSENVRGRGECLQESGAPSPFNNEKSCISGGHNWHVRPAHGVDPPECISADIINVRDNHLGNTYNGQLVNYKWYIPNDVHENCVVRIRYNITTGDYHPFETDSTFNYPKSPLKQDPFENFEYPSWLSLAVNTNQYGRTFQDRSYVFSIKERPSTIPAWAKIYNLNVRGKRGNIVQTFPSTEYDFVPNFLEARGGDFIHIQWTGSDYNPQRNPNDAEGAPNTGDRSNLVQSDNSGFNYPRNYTRVTMFLKDDGTPDLDFITRLAFIDQPIQNTSECMDWKSLLEKNGGNKNKAEQDCNNCAKLNNAPNGPYFDGGLHELKANGMFAYMSTRNNNFSNRSHKGYLIVTGARFNNSDKLKMSMTFIGLIFMIILML